MKELKRVLIEKSREMNRNLSELNLFNVAHKNISKVVSLTCDFCSQNAILKEDF